MSKLSDRLAQAKSDLKLTAAAMVRKAEAHGYSLSDYNAKVYTNGKHPKQPELQTLQALSFVLEVPLQEVLDLADVSSGDVSEPFEPHKNADLLTAPQRDAVNEIIRLLADGNRSRNEQEPRAETPATQHPSTNRREDGSTPGRPGAPMTPDELARRRTAQRQAANDARPAEELHGMAANEGDFMDEDNE